MKWCPSDPESLNSVLWWKHCFSNCLRPMSLSDRCVNATNKVSQKLVFWDPKANLYLLMKSGGKTSLACCSNFSKLSGMLYLHLLFAQLSHFLQMQMQEAHFLFPSGLWALRPVLFITNVLKLTQRPRGACKIKGLGSNNDSCAKCSCPGWDGAQTSKKSVTSNDSLIEGGTGGRTVHNWSPDNPAEMGTGVWDSASSHS